ncbi:MAG: FtsQ-type POTRA domain-containing protein [Magnetococcales bacterium]|nr:FtsQ-type POTRA domain-containing protein [Magnetococcales bacterium]
MYRKIFMIVALVFIAGGLYLGWNEARKPGRFPLQEIHLEGVVHTDVEQALEIINVDKGTNLFAIDLDSVKKSLSTLPWIRSVQVKRVFPNQMAIQLVEKIAVCMGKQEDRLNILDEYGSVIKWLEPKDPLIFPVVTTPDQKKERPARIVWLINLLGRHPWLKEQISQAIGYAGNRWILYTDKGVKLLLSENADRELDLLMRLQNRYNILNRPIKQVELRIPGRAAVRVAGL